MAKANKTELQTVEPKDIRSGMQVRVHHKIKDLNKKGEERERIQVYEGLVIAKKHGNEIGSTFTVRKVTEGIGVEKTYPTFSPLVEKVEVVDQKVVNRAKLYFTRGNSRRLRSVNEKKLATKV